MIKEFTGIITKTDGKFQYIQLPKTKIYDVDEFCEIQIEVEAGRKEYIEFGNLLNLEGLHNGDQIPNDEDCEKCGVFHKGRMQTTDPRQAEFTDVNCVRGYDLVWVDCDHCQGTGKKLLTIKNIRLKRAGDMANSSIKWPNKFNKYSVDTWILIADLGEEK